MKTGAPTAGPGPASPRIWSAGFQPAVLALLLTLLTATIAHAAPPIVTSIRAAQRTGTHLVDIYYNVAAGGPCTVYVAVSDNGGTSYGVPVSTLIGAVGPGVTPGNDRHAVWNAGTDWAGQFSSQCRVKIIADDHALPPVSGRMVFIPGGAFSMGDSLGDAGQSKQPVHPVNVSAFLMDQSVVTGESWVTIASSAGYAFSKGGASKGLDHPVQTLNWYDAVKWCNARSEKEGLTPCYYTDAGQTVVYRTGQVDLANSMVKWTANGYRLPTEAEWEKAARGGQRGKRFPWGDTITHSQANYNSDPIYATGAQPYTSPIGSFAANGYGLYDMAGNVFQWCWDGYDGTWYEQTGATVNDPRGPTFVSNRVLRGGYWGNVADNLRCALRSYGPPTYAGNYIGFRCVRGL